VAAQSMLESYQFTVTRIVVNQNKVVVIVDTS